MEEVHLERKEVDKRKIVFSRARRRALKHVGLIRVALIAGIFLAIYLLFVVVGAFFKKTDAGYYFGLASDFIFAPEEKIKAIGGRTNVLILGKGGGGHEAPDLTDTIIFVSVNHEDKSATLISLPRDIWIPELRAKLNSTYYWGEQKREGGGLILAKSTVEEIVGKPVQYGVVVDFSGFKRIIDTLEGIEFEVERSFTDERYPIPGREDDDCGGDDPEFLCRYETIHFDSGRQLMDGETALKFARSRNAEGEEGTDFARAARQEKVLSAIKEKVLSGKIILSPKKMFEILKVVEESVETDMELSARAILARRIVDAKENITSDVISEEFLVNPPISPRYDNLYVFIPKGRDPESSSGQAWGEVHEWVECVLENGECN